MVSLIGQGPNLAEDDILQYQAFGPVLWPVQGEFMGLPIEPVHGRGGLVDARMDPDIPETYVCVIYHSKKIFKNLHNRQY